MKCLDEANEDEAAAIHSTLAFFESILDVQASATVDVAKCGPQSASTFYEMRPILSLRDKRDASLKHFIVHPIARWMG
eukprot:scaffold207042_cov32-Tisochrysis_lutea.AAC.2